MNRNGVRVTNWKAFMIMEKYSRGGKHIISTKPISKNQYCVIAFRIFELGVGKIRQIYRVRYDNAWRSRDCSCEPFAEHRFPRSSFHKGCDVGVPDLLIMTVVQMGGEACMAEWDTNRIGHALTPLFVCR